jgi:hypothetical protein
MTLVPNLHRDLRRGSRNANLSSAGAGVTINII